MPSEKVAQSDVMFNQVMAEYTVLTKLRTRTTYLIKQFAFGYIEK